LPIDGGSAAQSIDSQTINSAEEALSVVCATIAQQRSAIDSQRKSADRAHK